MMAQGELHKYIQLIQVQGEHLVRCDEALVWGKLSLLKFECSYLSKEFQTFNTCGMERSPEQNVLYRLSDGLDLYYAR